jgi:methylated-DNA-[protein]-cysteine S-methyltransferase
VTRRHTLVPSPIGPLTVVKDDDVLLRLYLEPPGPRADLGPRDEAACADVSEQLDEYFAGGRERFDLALHPVGGEFDMAVWAELSRIPYGETHTYGSVAKAVGEPGAAQAVGLACGRNPLPIVIPCHRVIGADSSLVGFGGGLPRKRFLLDLEQRDSRLF